MHKILFWLFFAKIKMATCLPETTKSGFINGRKIYDITQIGNLDSTINECSGLARVFGKKTFWTHNDGGGQPQLYEIDSLGKLISTLKVPDATNIDWEELAQDNQETIFVGDFGNNQNARRDLKIYKFDPNKAQKTEEINFSFADQAGFPPPKKQRNFDCEAFFWANDSLYLFSKNRGNRHTKMYSMPSNTGNYVLNPKANIYLKASITAAAISPSNSQFVLLSYGKVFVFGIDNNQINFNRPLFCIKTALKQSEAITYITENELLITNEQGQIFKLILKP
jgi:hypothetical protein